ncbi:DNA mismatch repair protein MutS [bacterium]|nr:DNA mismatch repair protein MutS [bacterium]
MDSFTPAMRQWAEVKARYPEHIVMFRMGDFYEMFYEDAEIAARLLDLALTARDKNSKNPVPLAGIPYHALTGYLARLVRANVRVAICEQIEDPKTAKGVVKRAVTRVVTAGVALEPETLDERAPNYLMGLTRDGERFGFAFADLSTGEFLVGAIADAARVAAEIARREPAEIVCPAPLREDAGLAALLAQADAAMVTWTDGDAFDPGRARAKLAEQFPEAGIDRMDDARLGPALASAGGVLAYLLETQLRDLPHVNRLSVFSGDEFMIVDETAKRNLELVASLREGGRRGSLLGVIDDTVTPMGARLIRQWLLYPLLDVEKIVARHDAVEELSARVVERDELLGLLRGVHDLERLCGRISLAACNARDLVLLRESLGILPRLGSLLATFSCALVKTLADDYDDLADVRGLLERAIEDEPPFSIREGGMIRTGHDAELDDLRKIAREGKGYLADLEARERERTGINKLRVSYNRVFGYYIEISHAHRASVPDDYIRKQTLVNAERYITPELKEYEEKVLTAQERIVEREFELFSRVRDEVDREIARIQAAAHLLATLDVLISFSRVAETHGYCRPQVDGGDAIVISDGRHPVVERLTAGERFVANDTRLDAGQRLLIITGPNMAGKSTYIRQVALIVLLAQVGCFVPAREAKIGVVDRIFTRVGASDNLARGQSTFMVEMSETADILRNATDRSLIVLDEIGRGTSTYDGLSIAWAVTEYLHDTPGKRAKTLFATHYHELVDLARERDRVKNFNVSILERDENLIFLHRIVAGGASRSFGVQVARLAGLPDAVVTRANEILKNLESIELDEFGHAKLAAPRESAEAARGQLTFFAPAARPPAPSAVERELALLDPENMTPMQALAALAALKGMLKRS